MFNIGDLYRKLVAVRNTLDDVEFEYEYYRILELWKEENGLAYVRIENIDTGARFDIDVSLMKYMDKVM
jgi:hypothetical protein